MGVRIVSGVDIPNELLQAARSNDLVLFIGAGASYNAPSSLPLFSGLVEQVAEKLGEAYVRTDNPDSFLGDIASRQPSVKHVVHSIISDKSSLPNSTHRAIARLAGATGARIVSTNYDEHVKIAAEQESIELGRQYFAPALPPGRDFDGFVYLHGSISESPETLVVTDQDFGRAYLTDGWARRFAHELFTNWTVLFIGYSHSDVVMTYLARGLPNGAKRFVLTAEPDHERWRQLSIVPVSYPPEHDHKALSEAIDIWAGLMRMGQLEHFARVKSIVSGVPPKEPADIDYLIDAVTSPAGAAAFTAFARSYDWLRWAEAQPDFKKLFQPGRDDGETTAIWIEWFVTHFVSDPEGSPLGLETFARLGPAMSERLIWSISRAQGRLRALSEGAARQWDAVLTAGVHVADLGSAALWYQPYVNPYEGRDLLPALRRALTPRLQLKEQSHWLHPVSDGDDGLLVEPTGVSASIVWPVAEAALKELWEQVAPDIDHVSADALQIAEQGLKDAYALVSAFDSGRSFDSWSFRRSAIDPHEQDQFHEDEDVIIDILRDCGAIRSSISGVLARDWILSDLPLFKRLGIHLLTEEHSAPRQRLSYVLDHNLLFDHDAKHEVFRFLETTAPGLTANGRSILLSAIKAGPPLDLDSIYNDDQFHRRAVFDRLEWLQRFVSGWTELDWSIEEIRRDQPDIGVRQHPDMDFWMESGTWGGKPPVSVGEFVAITESEGPWAAILNLVARDYSEQEFNEPTWDDAVGLLREAVASRPVIGVELMPVISITPMARYRELTSAVIYGWSDATLDETQEQRIIPLLMEAAANEDMASAVGTYIRAATRRAETPARLDALSPLDDLARLLWESHAEGFAEPGWSDVSMLGLNTWPGHLAQFWVTRISLRWQLEREAWTGLSSIERVALRSMVPSPSLSEAKRAALSVLASNYSFLFSADRQFALDHLSVIFDSKSTPFAPDAWFCFLHSPRASPDLLDSGFWEQLRSSEDVILGYGGQLSPSRYWRLLAAITVFSTAVSVDRAALIDDLALRPQPDALAHFLKELGSVLNGENPELVGEVWSKWLGDAMTRRFSGPPEMLTMEERAAWGNLALETMLGPAVEISMRAPGPIIERTRFRHFDDTSIRENGPLLVAAAKARLAVTEPADWRTEHVLSELVSRVGDSVDQSSMEALVEAALMKGITSAVSWLPESDFRETQ